MTPGIAKGTKKVHDLSEQVLVLPDVYEPCDDTYLLMEAALNEVRPTDSVLEVGTGCGVIAKRVAERARCVIATDKNPRAVENARLNGVEAIKGDLFGDLDIRCDLIIFNPPYLPSRSDISRDWQTQAWDGGPSGREVIVQFLSQVGNYLTQKGRVLLVISSITGYKEVTELMRAQFGIVKAIAERKFFFETLYVVLGAEATQSEGNKRCSRV
ncbi:MAG: HemK2/MTQ2 family protein methyltransferase [Halobacteriota archaeon]